MRTAIRFAFAAVCFAASAAESQVVTSRRGDDDRNRDWTVMPRAWAGGTLTYANPTGEFKDYVNAAFGANGHFYYAFDESGIVAFRADLAYLNYGSTTRRQQLGGGALGLIAVDVTTSNNILTGGLGLQLMSPSGAIRPYVNGTLGFSYFFTESRVDGSSNTEPFATTKNYDDGGFSPTFGGGVYIPLKLAIKNPVMLDIGIQSHANSDVSYLTKESIHIAGSNSQPVITPVRSAANYLSFRVGVTIGVR